MNKTITRCVHLNELLEIQKNIIQKHLDEHKWFRHIPDEEQAKTDFIDQFGWIMRELYCGYACKERFECEIAKDKDYLPKQADPK